MSEELWTEVCDIVQEAVMKTIFKEKKKKNAKDHTQEKKMLKGKTFV